MEYKNKIMETMLELCAVAGISGDNTEKLAGYKIYEVLERMDYFKQHPENLIKVQIKEDPFQRSYIIGLYLGYAKSNKTVILTGHYDVVGVEEFGHLRDIAFNPIEFTKRVSELYLNENAKEDLQTGDYIFGRGTADMKFGLALDIEILRHFIETGELEGNILFLAVPGEESNSEGMLAALESLLSLQKEYDLSYEALVLGECSYPLGNKVDKEKIYFGSCGKVMPLFFAVGKETHASEPFTGLNANLLISKINSLMELNLDLNSNKKELSPPPMCLKQGDLKELYSIQSPVYAYSYFNLIILELEGKELMGKLKSIGQEAFLASLKQIKERALIYEDSTGEKLSLEEYEPIILTFKELYLKCKECSSAAIEEELRAYVKNLDKLLDKQAAAVSIIKFLVDRYPVKKPMIIVAFAPPFYPPKAPLKETTKLMEAVNYTLAYAKENFGLDIEKRQYFMGISDLSYTGLDKEALAMEFLEDNIVGLDLIYTLPMDKLKALDIPAIVFGGYGKDFHKYTERLKISYSFQVLPTLYEQLIKKVLRA